MKKGSKAAEPDTNGTASETAHAEARRSDARRSGARRSDARRSDARRKYDPEQTRRNILDVATEEFSAMGLTGARVDAIAERTNTTKRMLYYYFGSKEGLYQAVLEKVYGDIRALEQDLHVSELEPVEGMRALVEFTFDYHDRHRDFVRLVTIENIHSAKYVQQSKSFKGRNATVIHTIEDLLSRGIAAGQFRSDVDPIDLHLLISSLCFHRIGSRHTFGTAFGRDPSQPRLRARHRAMIVDAVLRFVRKES
ncbi:MAG TPA: TetR/AcrR family transcriptional regulator [Paraburkholderia sp.]|jgi:AcrR family transcriptional regulator|nr:TetR/AcrR family transcriptional regulator [Paraburkholderia sp.]